MFANAAGQWLAEVRAFRRAATAKSYTSTINKLLAFEPQLRDRALTRADVVRWREHLKTAEGLDGTTVAKHVQTLKAFCSWIEQCCPELHAKVSMAKLPSSSEKIHRDWSLTDEQVEAILRTARERDPHVYVLLRICASTGLRVREATNLRWADVGAETLTVSPKPGIWEAKTAAAYRSIGRPALVAWLAEIRAARAAAGLPAGPADVVCVRNDAAEPWSEKTCHVNARVRRVFDAAGVDARHRTVHRLRTTLATAHAALGTPVAVAQREMGHAKATMMLDVYVRLQSSQVTAAGADFEARRGR